MTNPMTPSPAPDRLTALIDEVEECASAWVQTALVSSRTALAEDDFLAALAALRAEAASVETELAEAEAYIAALRGPLLWHFGTTDPELLREVWADAARATTPEGN